MNWHDHGRSSAISPGGSGTGSDASIDASAHREPRPGRLSTRGTRPLGEEQSRGGPGSRPLLDSRRPTGHPLRGLLVSEFVGAFIVGAWMRIVASLAIASMASDRAMQTGALGSWSP